MRLSNLVFGVLVAHLGRFIVIANPDVRLHGGASIRLLLEVEERCVFLAGHDALLKWGFDRED